MRIDWGSASILSATFLIGVLASFGNPLALILGLLGVCVGYGVGYWDGRKR